MTAEAANIRENPFDNATDPRLAYFDMPRRNAVARLLTALYQGEGLFLLVGEDGIGKSTLLSHLGAQVAALAGVCLLHVAPVLRCTQTAGFAELVDRFAAPFNAAGGDPLHLARLLQDLTSAGEQMPAMLIDDADRLDDASLKAIATLATLRGGERRLLSVVLAGTPQLSRRLAAVSGEGSPLAATQVISLMPMSRAEAERMIRHRVRQTGGSDLEEALAPQISELAGRCNGIPQQVLGLCRRVLDISPALAPRLSLPAVIPDRVANGDATGAVAAGGAFEVAPAGADPALSANPPPLSLSPPVTAAGPGLAGSEGSAWPTAFASAEGARPQPAFAGFADAAGAPAGVQPPGDAPMVASGHIRYSAASARRVEPARWENARRRSRSRWGITLLSATALVGLGVGWALYDRSHTKLAEVPLARDAGRDPASMAALPPPLAPSLVPPLDSPPARVGASPVLPEASTAETWWKPPPAGEPLSDDPAAPSTLSGATSPEPAPVVPPAVQHGPTTPPATEPSATASASPVPVPAMDSAAVAQAPVPAIPPRPVPKAAPPVAPAQHVDSTPRAAANAVETAELPPVRQAETKPETKPSPRGRQGAALLMEGDEYFSAGDIKAARAIYQEAAEQGSAEAARRLAQTFDPRNVAATSRDASAAEAILWYKDAARRGDRRARGELEGLETWLEDAAASGNAEAQRVLQTWRSASTDGARGHSSAEP